MPAPRHEEPTPHYVPKIGDIVMDCDPRSDAFYGQILQVTEFDLRASSKSRFLHGTVLVGAYKSTCKDGGIDCAFIHECKRLTKAQYRTLLIIRQLEGTE